jgi:hypothetical protein
MAKKPALIPITAERLDAIVSDINSVVSDVRGAIIEQAEATEALDTATESGRNVRETVMERIARLAVANTWSEQEFDVASRAFAKTNNSATDKSLSTFVSECKIAAHPDVREHFAAVLSVRNECWAGETALPDGVEKPCKAAWKRQYHMLRALLSAVRDTGLGTVRTPTDVLEFARRVIANPAPATALKAIERIAADLGKLATFWPDDDITAAIDNLSHITLDTLKAIADARTKGEDARLAAHKITPAHTPAEASTPTPTPVRGAVDIYNDLMNEAA